ncbi:MAG: hypothetical protein WC866_06275 [Patescibacteria group bacterium]|jgi:hypothetical protein
MRNGAQILVVSGLFAATVIAALVLFVSNAPKAPVVQPVTPQPVTQPQPAPSTSHKIYTNTLSGFSVQYPDTILHTEDTQDMQLSGYIPVCDPDYAVVCFPIPKDAYAGTNFGSAAFAVHLRDDLKTSSACETWQGGELVDGDATINGTSYKKFSYSEGAMSHRLDGENYRTFRDGTCFELSTRVATTVFEVYEPGTVKLFSDANRSALQAALDAMLTSFRFASGS